MRSLILLTLSLCCGSALSQGRSYPQPQTASASGQPAPDFALKDQIGADFKLAQQRGSWVLLYFYRGYW